MNYLTRQLLNAEEINFIEKELEHMANYHDKIEVLENYFMEEK